MSARRLKAKRSRPPTWTRSLAGCVGWSGGQMDINISIQRNADHGIGTLRSSRAKLVHGMMLTRGDDARHRTHHINRTRPAQRTSGQWLTARFGRAATPPRARGRPTAAIFRAAERWLRAAARSRAPRARGPCRSPTCSPCKPLKAYPCPFYRLPPSGARPWSN